MLSGRVLWGGFQDPKTKLAAAYQVVCAFVILVVVAAYTANLASIMTLARTPRASFTSVNGLIAANQAACTITSYAQTKTYFDLYPSLHQQSFASATPIAAALNRYECSAAIVPRIEYDTWLTQADHCELTTVGPSLFFASAGWVRGPMRP